MNMKRRPSWLLIAIVGCLVVMVPTTSYALWGKKTDTEKAADVEKEAERKRLQTQEDAIRKELEKVQGDKEGLGYVRNKVVDHLKETLTQKTAGMKKRLINAGKGMDVKNAAGRVLTVQKDVDLKIGKASAAKKVFTETSLNTLQNDVYGILTPTIRKLVTVLEKAEEVYEAVKDEQDVQKAEATEQATYQ